MCEKLSLENVFISLISAAINQTLVDDDVKKRIDDDMLISLYELGEKHHITHIMADVLLKEKLIINPEIEAVYRANIFSAINKTERIVNGLHNIENLFEDNQIPFIPLKGAVIRALYPKDWYRSSSDIDILVKKEDLDRAKILLEKNCKYKLLKMGPHDLSFVTEKNLNVELHFDLVEKDGNSVGKNHRRWNASFLEGVWERAKAKEGYEYYYVLSNTDFYVYNIAHMAKHFENGGCGIRSIVDLFLIDNMGLFDNSVEIALSESGLSEFCSVMRSLSLVWFGNEPCDDATNLAGEFIMNGGVFGNPENKATFGNVTNGGKTGYVLSRIFMPYSLLKTVHPILESHKWLYPFYVVKRWFKVFSCDTKERVLEELKTEISVDDKRKTEKLINKLGL